MLSPEERALELAAVVTHAIGDSLLAGESSPKAIGKVQGIIAAAIREAVEAEREECAMVADSFMQPELDAYGTHGDKKPPLFAAKVRNAIRDRSDPPAVTADADVTE